MCLKMPQSFSAQWFLSPLAGVCAASKGIHTAATLAELRSVLAEGSWAVVQRTDMYVCVLSLSIGFLRGLIK